MKKIYIYFRAETVKCPFLRSLKIEKGNSKVPFLTSEIINSTVDTTPDRIPLFQFQTSNFQKATPKNHGGNRRGERRKQILTQTIEN